MDKSERLRVFFGRLIEAQSVSTASNARSLLETVLNQVEDEHSGIPFSSIHAMSWQSSDGRMYPPADDSERGTSKSFRRFRTKGNIVYFGMNGSIRIENLHGDILLDKAGADGRRIGDP